MASEARINISASDNASRTINSVQGGLRNLATNARGSILTGVGLGAGISTWRLLGDAIAGTIDFLADSIVAAREEQVSIQKLTTALEANIVGWDGETEAIEEVIASRMRLGFSDDEQRNSLALLVAATGDINKALDLERTAMDLVRLTGVDLETASQQLIKVDTGLLRLLKSLGITLDENATSTEAVAAVQAIAAGQAEDYAASNEGALTALHVAFDELKEEIGDEFLPILYELGNWLLEDGIPAISDFIAEVKKVDWGAIVEGIGAVIDAFRTLVGWIIDAVQAIHEFNRLMGGNKSKGGQGSFGGGTGNGGGGGSSGFGPTSIVLDGRELQASSARWGYYSTGGNSRLPR